jgi:hypothetical protein
VVTPFTESTETLHELLESQPPLFVVVVTPLTELTETLHEEELCTTTLLETVVPLLVVPGGAVPVLAPESPEDV